MYLINSNFFLLIKILQVKKSYLKKTRKNGIISSGILEIGLGYRNPVCSQRTEIGAMSANANARETICKTRYCHYPIRSSTFYSFIEMLFIDNLKMAWNTRENSVLKNLRRIYMNIKNILNYRVDQEKNPVSRKTRSMFKTQNKINFFPMWLKHQ